MADVVVVGAGLSGARACQRLRAEGFGGRIAVVGAEPDLPYDRPPLTTHPGTDTDLARTMGIDVRELADEVRLGARATGLRRTHGGWTVQVEAVPPPGESAGPPAPAPVSGTAVVVATGAAPLLPAGWRGALVLHTRVQAGLLWSRIVPGAVLVIVGGGWIGCEVALTAAGLGAGVTLLEAADQLLPDRVPAEVAARVADLLRGAGVELATACAVADVRPADGRLQVRTPDRAVAADLVVAALGVRPDTSWLPGDLARTAQGAVRTDPWGRSSLPGVFALGDAAARWSPRAGLHRPGGHWTEAFTGPESVAPAVSAWLATGGDPATWTARPSTPADDPVAYTFSDLGDHRLLVLGDAQPGPRHQVVWRGDEAAWTAYVVRDGRLHGVCALDRPRDVVVARRAMRSAPRGRPRVSEVALADPVAAPALTFPAEGSP